MKMALGVMFVLLMVAMLIFGNTNIISADPGSQTWYLYGEEFDSYPMYKGDVEKNEGLVLVPDGGSEIWYSDETASTDVIFPAGTWNGRITFPGGSDTTVRVKGGIVGGKVYTQEEMLTLSRLPGREQMLAILLGTINAPLQKFVSALNGITQKLVRTLQAVADSKAGE